MLRFRRVHSACTLVLALTLVSLAAAADEKLTIDWIFSTAGKSAASLPSYAWIDTGIALLYDTVPPKSERTIKSFDPETRERTVVVDAELAVESARLQADDARRELATLLGVSTQACEIVLLSPLPDVPPEIPDAERLVEVARRVRLDIQAARQAALAARARWEEQKRLVFPRLELGVEFERGERKRQGGRDLLADTARASVAGGGLTAPDIQPRSERGAGMDFIIGPSLSMELPVFDQNQAQIARARYAVEQAVRTLDALDREVTQEIRGAVDRSVTAWRLVKIYRERSLPLAESSLDLSREAYKAGRASFLSVLEAQRFFLDSRSRYLEAAGNAAITIPQLERTVGLPFPELINNARAVAESVRSEGVGP